MSNTDIRIMPIVGPLGADAWGVDLERLSDEDFEVLHRAWLDHDGILRIPGQFVAAETLLAFSARFGELDLAPTTTKGHSERYRPDLPHLVVISNIVENGKALGGLGSYESKWHTDMSYNEVPPKASVLHAIEIPSRGGDTGYANMYKGYEALPETTRRRIAGLTCKHDASRNSVGEVRRGYKQVYERREEVPGAVHPIVCTHPETGRKCLYLGRRDLAFIPQLPPAESDALLDELWAHATQDKFTWYQNWRLGDIVIWDNRCTMHRRDSLDPGERRLLNRAQVKGERPLAAAEAA
jgi:taurine dioxygenase